MEDKTAITRSRSHAPRLVLTRHVYKIVYGDSVLGRLNTWVAVKITKSVGSMWCAYLFTVIALISLPSAIKSGDPIVIVSWIAQTFLQLVLLPIIIVGQNVQAAASESDHETLLAIHTLTSEVHKIQGQQSKILQMLAETSNE